MSKKLSNQILLSVLSALFLTISSGNLFAKTTTKKDIESKFYFGANGNWSYVKNSNIPLGNAPDDSILLYPSSSDGEATGFGFELGVKNNLNRGILDGTFVSFELFYDNLENKTKSPLHYHPEWLGWMHPATNITISERHGAKMHLGHTLFSNKLEGFLTVGAARVSYEHNWYPDLSSNIKKTSRKFHPLVGFGFNYNINETLTIRTSYDYQQFEEWRLDARNETMQSKLHVVRLGAIVHF